MNLGSRRHGIPELQRLELLAETWVVLQLWVPFWGFLKGIYNGFFTGTIRVHIGSSKAFFKGTIRVRCDSKVRTPMDKLGLGLIVFIGFRV